MASGLKAATRRRFADHERYLAEHEPKLHLAIDTPTGNAIIAGTMDIATGPGMTTSCGVRIEYEGLSPFRLPTTYQTDSQFPPEPARHIQTDQAYCLWLPQAAPRDFNDPCGLAMFLLRLHHFLELQFVFDDRVRRGLTPPWPGPEWGHGAEGHQQWVREYAATAPTHAVRGLLVAALSPPRPSRPCPCATRRPFNRCHHSWVMTLRSAIEKHAEAKLEVCRILEEIDASSSA